MLAACSGKYFKHVQPKNKSTEIPFIPAFSWERLKNSKVAQ